MMYDGRGCHVEQSETCRPNRQEIRSTYNQRFDRMNNIVVVKNGKSSRACLAPSARYASPSRGRPFGYAKVSTANR